MLTILDTDFNFKIITPIVPSVGIQRLARRKLHFIRQFLKVPSPCGMCEKPNYWTVFYWQV